MSPFASLRVWLPDCHPEPIRFAQGNSAKDLSMGSGCFPFTAFRASAHSLNMTCPNFSVD